MFNFEQELKNKKEILWEYECDCECLSYHECYHDNCVEKTFCFINKHNLYLLNLFMSKITKLYKLLKFYNIDSINHNKISCSNTNINNSDYFMCIFYNENDFDPLFDSVFHKNNKPTNHYHIYFKYVFKDNLSNKHKYDLIDNIIQKCCNEFKLNFEWEKDFNRCFKISLI